MFISRSCIYRPFYRSFGDNNIFPSNVASVLELIGGGSRPSTPVSLNSRKSPTTDMGVQATQKDGNRRGSRGNNQSNQLQERRDSGRLDGQGLHDNRVSNTCICFLFDNT